MEDIIEQSTVQTLTLSIASFERCISELIANSLNAHAAAIAVRIHAGKREIQIVDNGVGIPNNMLKRIAEYDAEVASNQQQVLPELKYLANARRLSDRLTIASRYQHSKETFMKVLNVNLKLSTCSLIK
ncbi:DNA mismatch repair protein Mlh3-like [Monomorium pharaonis]|uniref:DNA mismatch repair protein Mlh3-like n=1 Tax=Monomorium pharaonis TaxID=307658 RepID=UPI001746FDA3|nr:DNA mismatch repair protein Mlh3-like [Monomorium pharaonis]